MKWIRDLKLAGFWVHRVQGLHEAYRLAGFRIYRACRVQSCFLGLEFRVQASYSRRTSDCKDRMSEHK